jgi:SAM-dependent methyltransferase
MAIHIRRGDFGKALAALRRRGLVEGLRHCRARWLRRFDLAFDQAWGVLTEGAVELERMGGFDSKALGEKYIPLNTVVFNRALSRLGLDYESFDFIDIGAGKGRLALLASLYPFRSVIGVEHAPELFAQMQENILNFHHPCRLCDRVEARLEDATRFEIPARDCILFLFNPLKQEGLARLVDNLRRSYHRTPRRIVILYLNPARRNRVRETLRSAEIFTIRTFHDPGFALLSRFPLLICETKPPG